MQDGRAGGKAGTSSQGGDGGGGCRSLTCQSRRWQVVRVLWLLDAARPQGRPFIVYTYQGLALMSGHVVVSLTVCVLPGCFTVALLLTTALLWI